MTKHLVLVAGNIGAGKTPAAKLLSQHFGFELFDEPVIDMNRTALAALRCTKRLEIVPGATHLFEEPGTLDRVVMLASDWFRQHLKQHLKPEAEP